LALVVNEAEKRIEIPALCARANLSAKCEQNECMKRILIPAELLKGFCGESSKSRADSCDS
jgi:hypothetical protein